MGLGDVVKSTDQAPHHINYWGMDITARTGRNITSKKLYSMGDPPVIARRSYG